MSNCVVLCRFGSRKESSMRRMGRPITITNDRLQHMLGVARACYEYSESLFGWDAEKCEEMFLMGFVHDFAYEFVSNQRDHEHRGGEILRRVGFAYADEVFLHGEPDVDDWSDELFILNYADLTTSSSGERCSFTQRLDSVIDRYGEETAQVERIIGVIERLEAFAHGRGLELS